MTLVKLQKKNAVMLIIFQEKEKKPKKQKTKNKTNQPTNQTNKGALSLNTVLLGTKPLSHAVLKDSRIQTIVFAMSVYCV